MRWVRLVLALLPCGIGVAQAPTLRGRVLQRNERPWAGAIVEARRAVAHPAVRLDFDDRVRVVADARGRFRMPLDPSHSWIVWAHGTTQRRLLGHRIARVSDPHAIRSVHRHVELREQKYEVLRYSGMIRGRIPSAWTKRVQVLLHERIPLFPEGEARLCAHVIPREDGQFELPAWPGTRPALLARLDAGPVLSAVEGRYQRVRLGEVEGALERAAGAGRRKAFVERLAERLTFVVGEPVSMQFVLPHEESRRYELWSAVGDRVRRLGRVLPEQPLELLLPQGPTRVSLRLYLHVGTDAIGTRRLGPVFRTRRTSTRRRYVLPRVEEARPTRFRLRHRQTDLQVLDATCVSTPRPPIGKAKPSACCVVTPWEERAPLRLVGLRAGRGLDLHARIPAQRLRPEIEIPAGVALLHVGKFDEVGGTVDRDLATMRHFTIVVRKPDGTPASGARVVARPIAAMAPESAMYLHADRDGRAHLWLPQGVPVELLASWVDGGHAASVISDSRPAGEFQLLGSATRLYRGVVADGEGKRCAAVVEASLPYQLDPKLPRGLASWRVRSNARGEFSIRLPHTSEPLRLHACHSLGEKGGPRVFTTDLGEGAVELRVSK